ncbi:MAG: PKD domain-containing protein, partial [Bacteroidota bacterium]
TFTYTFFDPISNCEGRDQVRIEVYPIPDVDAGPDTTYCLVPDPQQLPTPNFAGGTWAGIGVSNPNTGIYIPNLLGGPGVDTLTYTYTSADGCVGVDTILVTVVIGDNAIAGPGDSLCYNAAIDTLPGFSPAGGAWSGIGITNAGAGEYNPLLMTPGQNQLIYTVAAGTSCEAADTTFVLVYDTLAVTLPPDITVCASDPDFPITGFAPAGGTWIGNGVSPTGVFSPTAVTPGTTSILTYTVVNADGCSSRETMEVFVAPLPTVAFTQPDSSCVNIPINFVNATTGAVSFVWDFGDGNASAQTNPTHSYGAAGSYTIKLIATSIEGCQDSLSRTIFINEAPIVNFSKDQVSGCAPLLVNFTDLSTPNGATYNWSFGNFASFNGPNPPPITFPQGTQDTTYYITLSLSNECTSVSLTDSVLVFPQPQVNFGTDVSIGCSPLPVNFANVSLGNPTAYFWYRNLIDPDSLITTDTIPQTQILTTGQFNDTVRFILVATNICGADTLTREVVVQPNTIDAFFNTNLPQGCAPHTVTFTDFSGAPFTGWDIDGTQPTGNSVSYTFINPGTYTVFHYANNGCSFDTNSVQITVFPAPFVDFSSNVTSLCRGDSVSFTNNSIATTGYQWDFGDGDTSMAINPVHVFDSAGTFTVVLTAFSDTSACPNTHTQTIVVRELPPATFCLSDTAGCPDLTVNFGCTPANLNYQWDFGGTGSSSVANPTHVFNTPGTYVVSLTTTDALGCQNDTSAQVFVYPVPSADFVIQTDTCGANVPVIFSDLATTTAGPLTYQWNFGDGNGSTQDNPSHIYGQTGLFSVQQRVENIFGCADSLTQSVRIFPQPVASLFADTLTGCVPLLVNFDGTASPNADQYRWTIDGTFASSNAQFSNTFTAPDQSFQVQLRVDTAGICFDSTSVTIETASEPVADFSLDLDEGCDSLTVNFTDLSSSTRTYTHSWDFGDGSPLVNTTNPSHTFGAAGTYIITLTITNDFDCVSSHQDTVRVYPTPVVDLQADTLTGCVPLLVNFDGAASQNASNYLWTIDGTFASSNAQFSNLFTAPDQSFVVQLQVDSAGFCFDSTSITIETASEPVADFSLDLDEGCDSLTVNFTDLSSSTRAYTHSWDFGDGSPLVSTTNPSHTFGAAGTYIITLTITNDFDCVSSHQDTVRVYPTPVVDLQADTLTG